MARRSDEREAARAEYMARKEKGGEVNLRQLADDLHLKYDTVRRWKSKDGWDTPTGRKPGGQPGNQNAVGNSGGGAPAGLAAVRRPLPNGLCRRRCPYNMCSRA